MAEQHNPDYVDGLSHERAKIFTQALDAAGIPRSDVLDLSTWYLCATRDGRLLLTHVVCEWQTIREDRLSVALNDLLKTVIRPHRCPGVAK